MVTTRGREIWGEASKTGKTVTAKLRPSVISLANSKETWRGYVNKGNHFIAYSHSIYEAQISRKHQFH